MFPLAWILGVACITNNRRIGRYALPLALIGEAIALWHSLLYSRVVKAALAIRHTHHGDYMGDHGLMLKLLLHFQGTIRVPFIWFDPSKPGGGKSVSDLASSIDISATILARAGVQAFKVVIC